MSAILQILYVILLIVIVVWLFRSVKPRAKAITIGLSAWILVSAFISGAVVNLIPRPTEPVVITALGTKNEKSQGNEVVLTGAVVDEKTYTADNISEGKWMWRGSDYMWRNENDKRQPDGLTRSITFNIPVGEDRHLKLDKSQYRGMAEVSYNGETKQYDLYNDKFQSNTVKIPSSDKFALYSMKIGRLLLFALFVLIMAGIPLVLIFRSDESKVRSFFARHWDKFAYIALSALAFGVMLSSALSKGAMWYDEVWSIGWMYMGREDANTLLFNLLTQLWFNIMPYGESNLLLLPILFTSASIYIVGITGAELRDKKLGIIAAAIAASSSSILSQAGMEFRPYFLVFFLSSLTLYLFIKKMKMLGNEKLSFIILYTVILTLAVDSHEFALASTGVLMVFDLILIIAKKSKKICLLEFVLPAGYLVYFMLTQFVSNMKLAGNYSWTKAPNLTSMFDAVKWISGNSIFLVIVMILGVTAICFRTVSRIRSHTFEIKKDLVYVALIVIPFVVFNFNVVYSLFINPDNSLFVNRYFTSLIIFAIIIIASTICDIIDMIKENIKTSKDLDGILSVFIVATLCITSWGTSWRIDKSDEKFRECADFVMSQNDIYSENTAYYLCGRDAVYYGMEYYLTHKGQRDLPRNYINIYYENLKTGDGDFEKKDYLTDFDKYDVIYISYLHWNKDSPICGQAFKILNKNYSLDYEKSDLKLARYVRK